MAGRFALVAVAFVLFQSSVAISAYKMLLNNHRVGRTFCNYYRESDDIDSCLLGYIETKCGTFKCLRTVGQDCSFKEEDHLLHGNRCGANLRCGCDKKCNGCMTVNGEEKCHEDTLICLPPSPGKRSNLPNQDEFDYPNRIISEERMVN